LQNFAGNSMDTRLPFFNWSLRKARETEPDNFIKARISIIFTILVFSLLKAAIVIGIGVIHEQKLQVIRAIVAFIVYISLVKFLLYRPGRLLLLAHIMLILGVAIVWTNIFFYAHKINLVTIQFVFMIALSSFYTMGSRSGVGYSVASILPVIIFLGLHGHVDMSFTGGAQELASPGYEAIVILNFVSLVVAHFLFYEALNVNLKEKEKLNLQLQLSIAEANKMAETKSNFLSTISHELRTPLNSVVGMAELLLNDKPEERQKENLKILHYSALDLLSLINNVLDFNKIDSDKLVLEQTPFNLAEFMQNISLGLKVKAGDKHLDFVLDVDQKLKRTNVVSAPTRLSQLIYNLVSNAIKFTEKGIITVKLSCVSTAENSIDVMFSVTDTGIGIHPERHETIFELFTQAESNITRKYGGTGLGLAIVKQVLALFKSDIQLESSPGDGSRFFFTISFTTTADVAKVQQPKLDKNKDFSMLKVLIAEDNNFNRLIYNGNLKCWICRRI
jgi:two-component system, sensor histidine kinase